MADFDVVPVSIVKSNETSAGQVSQNFVLIVTEKGYGKRIEIHEFKIQKRGGKGVTAIKFKQKAGGSRASNTDGDADALSCMRICREDDDVVMSTSKGNVVRQRVGDLSIQSRTATGFLIQKLAKDDSIVMVDVVPPLIPVEQLPSSSQPASLKV
jgi:DNA gyrase subunit A